MNRDAGGNDAGSSEARLDILTRISRAGARSSGALARAAIEASLRDPAEVVAQFVEFAREYRAHVTVAAAPEVPSSVASLLYARGSERVVVPADLPEPLLPMGAGMVRDEGFGHRVLDQAQAVVTTCAVAIAETGTVVLDAGPGQGRRALTLIPDHHVCIVFEEQIVDSVPHAVARLEPSVLAGRPLTWISGPSATSDIELSRVEGVHGPRLLDIVVVRRP